MQVNPAIFSVVLIAFILYRRIKRSIGYQKLALGRMRFRVVMFSILGIVIAAAGVYHPLYWLGDAVGLGAGLLLAKYAIKHSLFDRRADGWYYRTHIGIELLVLALFLGRIAYRMIAMYAIAKADPTHPFNANPYDPQAFTKDPFTAAILFVIIAYYIGFFGFLMRKGKELQAGEQV